MEASLLHLSYDRLHATKQSTRLELHHVFLCKFLAKDALQSLSRFREKNSKCREELAVGEKNEEELTCIRNRLKRNNGNVSKLF